MTNALESGFRPPPDEYVRRWARKTATRKASASKTRLRPCGLTERFLYGRMRRIGFRCELCNNYFLFTDSPASQAERDLAPSVDRRRHRGYLRRRVGLIHVYCNRNVNSAGSVFHDRAADYLLGLPPPKTPIPIDPVRALRGAGHARFLDVEMAPDSGELIFSADLYSMAVCAVIDLVPSDYELRANEIQELFLSQFPELANVLGALNPCDHYRHRLVGRRWRTCADCEIEAVEGLDGRQVCPNKLKAQPEWKHVVRTALEELVKRRIIRKIRVPGHPNRSMYRNRIGAVAGGMTREDAWARISRSDGGRRRAESAMLSEARGGRVCAFWCSGCGLKVRRPDSHLLCPRCGGEWLKIAAVEPEELDIQLAAPSETRGS